MRLLYRIVMKNGFARLLAVVSGLLFSIIMPAQERALLPADPAIVRTVLPNGLICYAAANPYVKGFTDYALVSKAQGQSLMNIRDVLSSDEIQSDSTLFRLMKYVADLKITSDLAVIVCGDINASKVLEKLKYMSYMIPAGGADVRYEYPEEKQSAVVFDESVDEASGMIKVCGSWTSPRIPEHLMNTVQTAVYDKVVYELGVILTDRVRRNLRENDIPVADVRFEHSGSLHTSGSESFSLSVTLLPEHGDAAADALQRALAETDIAGAPASDLRLAENRYFRYLSSRSSSVERTNEEYMHRCMMSYLYNAPLTSSGQRLDFFRSKDISDQTREMMFHGVSSALIDVDKDSLLFEARDMCDLSDTLSFPDICPKVKVRSSKKDPLSSGTIWTFSNGFKVVYRRMPTARTMYYSLALNSGYGNVDGLRKGEGAFMSDFLDLCYISGIKSADFKRLLLLSGVTMDQKVNVAEITLSGKVADRNVPLLMRSLLAVVNERTPDTTACSYYFRSENLRLNHAKSSQSVPAAIDSLFCKDYIYSSYKSAGHLYEDTMDKAAQLWDEASSRVNDGVLVLVGDMDETTLKKILLQYAGGFRTRESASWRTGMTHQMVSGSTTYTAEGGDEAVVVAMSTRLPMTMENHIAAILASNELEHQFTQKLSPYGMTVRLSSSLTLYPEDRFSIMLSIRPDKGQQMPKDALELIREVIDSAAAELPEGRHLTAYKNSLKHSHGLSLQDPEYWIAAMTRRYMDGKDFTTGFQAKTDAVAPEKVRDVIAALLKGGRIEYIIKNR